MDGDGWTPEKNEEVKKIWTISPDEDSKKKSRETGESSKNGGKSNKNH